ncbi:hypothetical protein E2562_032414 [Oryza meyeriana var. granulata]|uniref:Uncharacterized protein n=1 Tax=Oryza meyeriana var. granulata TaxID=110450 RepID=A0A6G1CX95_9ORYZ|nr:hypothetical protein E2562_032414 [Oryza meyeriana var. granulata]
MGREESARRATVSLNGQRASSMGFLGCAARNEAWHRWLAGAPRAVLRALTRPSCRRDSYVKSRGHSPSVVNVSSSKLKGREAWMMTTSGPHLS